MMNKEGFLKELQASLAVLAESERQDILNEYAQHIDLRVAGGLTEEEAIRDFGDLDQLRAEILEAYHVDPAFGQAGTERPAEKKRTIPDPRPALRQGVRGAGGALRRAGAAVSGWFRRLWRSIRNGAARAWAAVRGLFAGKRTPEERKETEQMEQNKGAASRAGKRLLSGAGRLCRALVRLIWNCGLLLCALPVAVLGMAAVVGLGLLVVLLFQGYPLAGAALMCLGGLAVCVGVLGLGSGLIWRRRSEEETGMSVETEGNGDA